MTLTVELFSGAGCASVGIARAASDPVVGFEWDADACATHHAAGFATVRCDVSAWPVEQMVGKVSGLWASPPCPQFSAAGSGAGNEIAHLLADCIADLLDGHDTRQELRTAAWGPIHLFTTQENDRVKKPKSEDWVWNKTAARVTEAALVCEPARWIWHLRPSWVACEQVPAVLPLWQSMAANLRALGYSTWAGVLDCADYGVPQNRHRAILMARQGARPVMPPPVTHSDHRRSPDLFLPSWVSMADALGWGLEQEPAGTVVSGTTEGGSHGLDGGSGARRHYARAQEAGGGHWRDR